MRIIINDRRYGALKTLGERKQVFNEVSHYKDVFLSHVYKYVSIFTLILVVLLAHTLYHETSEKLEVLSTYFLITRAVFFSALIIQSILFVSVPKSKKKTRS